MFAASTASLVASRSEMPGLLDCCARLAERFEVAQVRRAGEDVDLQVATLKDPVRVFEKAASDYDNDPGNGVLFITGYVAVDGKTLYGWYEPGIKLG